MIDARIARPRGDGEIHPRVFQHPFGVIVFDHGGSRVEQGGVEGDGRFNLRDADVEVQPLHMDLLRFDISSIVEISI